jgi:hypothetical protein
MDKFLSDQRKVVFIAALLGAMYSWGSGFDKWADCTTTHAVFGLCGIVASVLVANMGSNVFKKPPTITETTEPKSSTTTTITTPPNADK